MTSDVPIPHGDRPVRVHIQCCLPKGNQVGAGNILYLCPYLMPAFSLKSMGIPHEFAQTEFSITH